MNNYLIELNHIESKSFQPMKYNRTEVKERSQNKRKDLWCLESVRDAWDNQGSLDNWK